MPQPDEEKVRLTRQWFAKAEHDLIAAERSLSGSPSLLDIAVYHCQQGMEKGLKGFLTWRDRPSRRTHDLVQLVQQCEDLDRDFVHLRSTAALLTPYASAFRYPGDLAEPEFAEAQEALRRARRAVELIAMKLPGVLDS